LSLTSVPEEEAAKGIDCAVICTNHSIFNYPELPKRFPLVVDTRNALKNSAAKNVFRL
jgi:UDP-N-acetyl-D-mannosaminuronate dehydrogenase